MTVILSGFGLMVAAIVVFVLICLGGWVRDLWRVFVAGTARP